MANILVVDDDALLQHVARRVLERPGHSVATAAAVTEAQHLLERQAFDLLLCDIRLPGQSGLKLVREVTARYHATAVVMITGVDDPAVADEALSIGVYGYLVKPFHPNELLISVATALRRRELELAGRDQLGELERMVQTRTAALERRARWAQSTLEHASDLIIVSGPDGIIRYASPSVERVLGRRPDEIRGHPALSLLDPVDEPAVREVLYALADLPGSVSPPVTIRFRHRNGTVRHLEVIFSRLGEDPDGVIANARDVTERVHTEERLREQTSILEGVLMSIGEGIVVTDTEGRVVLTNRAAERFFGVSPIRPAGEVRPVTTYFLPDRITPVPAEELPIARALKGVPTDDVQIFVQNAAVPDGIHVESTGRPVHDERGRPVGAVAVFRDVTARHLAEAAQAEATRLAVFTAEVGRAFTEGGSLSDVLRRCTDAMIQGLDVAFANVWTVSDDGTLLELQASSGRSAAGGGGTPATPGRFEVGLVIELRQSVLTSLASGELWVGDQEWARREGVVAFAGYPLMVADRLVGAVTLFARGPLTAAVYEGMRSVADEIALGIDHKRAEEALAHQALHDQLTGLPNRALLVDRIDGALARATRGRSVIAVLFLDLDGFKLINDSHGHAVGDKVLIEVAKRAAKVFRPADTVARFGGDEFVAVAETSDERTIIQMAERLMTAIGGPLWVDDEELFVNVSVGIALGHAGDSAETLLRNADTAMYQAKEKGRGRIELFDEAARTRLRGRLAMDGGLRRAVRKKEFTLHYQPVVSLASGAIVGAEALVRWEHPERGLVPPDAFVPFAEESGLIVPIGDWILAEACRNAARWKERTGVDLFVSVNVSGRQLGAPGFITTVRAALATSGLPADALSLEITETSLIHDVDSSIESLSRLKDLGVRTAIDDFGTGYSSLSYLNRLPIDVLKIDKSFITGLDVASRDTAILSAIIAIGSSLGFQVLAEGIERSEQLLALRALSCDLGQGFYFASPTLNDAFEDVVRSPQRW